MSSSETWTIGRLLAWTTDYLAKNGADCPRLDAELLLARARGCQRIELYTAFEEEVAKDVRGEFRELVKKRAGGTPVAYLLGEKEFYSLSFRVTSDVLIPRPETEHLVVAALDRAKKTERDGHPLRVVDVGTGSGIIAVCLAKHLKLAEILGVDIGSSALEVAMENADIHGVSDRVKFIQSDLLRILPAEPTFDLILSNPPYVSEAEYAQLARDVREHEPYGALVGGPKGTELIAKLIPQSAERLVEGGWLIIEISPMILDDVRTLIEADGRFGEVEVIYDLSRHPRVVAAQRVATA
jgi:release factor glutamine methyltransferase